MLLSVGKNYFIATAPPKSCTNILSFHLKQKDSNVDIHSTLIVHVSHHRCHLSKLLPTANLNFTNSTFSTYCKKKNKSHIVQGIFKSGLNTRKILVGSIIKYIFFEYTTNLYLVKIINFTIDITQKER